MSHRTIITVSASLFLAAIAAVAAFFGSPDIALAISMGAVGIVVAGKETDKMTSLEDLQELRNGVVKNMGSLRTKFQGRADADKGTSGSWEGEERKQWDDASQHVDDIDARMIELRSSDSMEERWKEIEEGDARDLRNRQQNVDINHPESGALKEVTAEDRTLAFQSWGRCQLEIALTKRQKQACKKLKFNPRRKKLDIKSHVATEDVMDVQSQLRMAHRSLHKDIIHRAMSASTATSGAEFVPAGFMTMLEEALFFYGNIRNVVDIWRTDSGNSVPWPTATDQDEGEWIGESITVANADPTTGNVLFGAHKISSKLIKVPTELLEDSAFNLAVWLPSIIGRRIGRGINRAATTGDGSGKPTGIVNSSALGITAATAGALVYSEFTRLEHSVDPNDRVNGSYMFHDNVLLALRLLVDADGRPLWQPGMQLGVPDRFNGRTFEINQHMDGTLAINTKPVLFGDFKKYKLREVRGIRVYRLEEIFRTSDQDGFVAFQRVDGKLVNAGTDPIKHIVMPAA